jgi:putative transposase
MIATIRQGLIDEGVQLSIRKLCRWLGIPRRTVYYRPTKKTPIVQERLHSRTSK